MAKKLAEKLGLGHYYPWKDIEEYLEFRLKGAGLSFQELKKNGIIRGAKQPNYFDEGVPSEFATPSGKIEFYSLQLEQAGFDPVPKYNRPKSGPPGSFRLLYGRAPVHSFSRTQSNHVLMDMMSENEIWVNAIIAARMGVKSGDYVRLKNQDGVVSNRIRVKATERIRPDCVYMVHGFGHNSKGLKFAHMKGASDTQLMTRYETDPLMGGTATNMNFVTIEQLYDLVEEVA
jgi:thiosulfate reductase/polysulfide reductase chain A